MIQAIYVNEVASKQNSMPFYSSPALPNKAAVLDKHYPSGSGQSTFIKGDLRFSAIKTRGLFSNKIHYKQSLTACRPQKEFAKKKKGGKK